MFMILVFFFCCFTDSHSLLNAVSLAIVLIVNIQNVVLLQGIEYVLNKKSRALALFFCFLEVIIAILSYAFILDNFFFKKIHFSSFLSPLEWGMFVSNHSLGLACWTESYVEEDTQSLRIFTYLCPLVLKTFSFYLYTYCLNNQPYNQEAVAFVENDDVMVIIAWRNEE